MNIPEVVDFLIETFEYNKAAARRRLKRALSDGSIHDIRPHISYIDWEGINWSTGEVKAMDPDSGSPVEYINITPTLKRRELEHYFKTFVDQTAPEKGAALDAIEVSSSRPALSQENLVSTEQEAELDTQAMYAAWHKRAKELKGLNRSYSKPKLAELISREEIAYERTSIIVTTNLTFGEWPSAMPR